MVMSSVVYPYYNQINVGLIEINFLESLLPIIFSDSIFLFFVLDLQYNSGLWYDLKWVNLCIDPLKLTI